MTENKKNKKRDQVKIAMIIAPKDFRDEELLIPKSLFEEKGLEVKIVSAKKESLGIYGGFVKTDIMLNKLKPANFDAIIFVGGGGALRYMENEQVGDIIKNSVKNNKILGAICIAPLLLANSGVLKGKEATVFSSRTDKKPIKILEQSGASYQSRPVVTDGNIITANGPKAARQFAEIIIEKLKS